MCVTAERSLLNTNKLVRTYDGILGLKPARQVRRAAAFRLRQSETVCVLIAVVLGPENTKALFGRIFAARLRLCKPEADDTGASRTARAPVTGGMVSAVFACV